MFNDVVELKQNDEVYSDIKKNNRRHNSKGLKKNKNIIDINMTGDNNLESLNNSTNLMTSSSKLNKFLENLNKGQSFSTFFHEKKKQNIK